MPAAELAALLEGWVGISYVAWSVAGEQAPEALAIARLTRDLVVAVSVLAPAEWEAAASEFLRAASSVCPWVPSDWALALWVTFAVIEHSEEWQAVQVDLGRYEALPLDPFEPIGPVELVARFLQPLIELASRLCPVSQPLSVVLDALDPFTVPVVPAGGSGA